MDQVKLFDKLIKITNKEKLIVRFIPFVSSYGRLKGDRIGLLNNMEAEDVNYTLAHELAHHFLHYDKGDLIKDKGLIEYEEQADRAAKMLLVALTV